MERPLGGVAAGVLKGEIRSTIPDRVDERYTAPLPGSCPCGGHTVQDEIKTQYQEEIVRRKIVRQFDVATGHCARCGKRLQGRHPLRTSDALDAAQVQIGPEALAFAAHLNKRLGVSYENTAAALRMGFGLNVSRSGLCRAVARMGRKAAPTYDPSYSALQKATRLCRQTVATALARLKELGIINWIRRCREDKDECGRFVLRQETNAYTILPPTQWRGYVPEVESEPPHPSTWGACPPLPSVLEQSVTTAQDGGSIRAIIKKLEDDPRDALAAALVGLGHALGL